jgi:NADP-dependent 3-hydroxy acid dehydrogenase YdfG
MGMPLVGSVVAVTGAGRGIGRAIAVALARAGARVALGDLDAGLARSAAAEIGPAAVGLELDVTDRGSFAGFLRAAESPGPLDALVNNAGIMHVGSFLAEDDVLTRGQFEVNVHGVLLGMKLALPGMVARGRGAVVNIASVAGRSGFPHLATYCATKHAVVGASDAVRAELAGTGVRISVVLPGVVDTELAAGAARSALPVQTPADVGAAVVSALRTGAAEVYVPRPVGVLQALLAPLPVRWRSALTGRLGGDRVFRDADPAVRRRYEARARASAARAVGRR